LCTEIAPVFLEFSGHKTNPNPDPNRYRRRCPDPNARIGLHKLEKIASRILNTILPEFSTLNYQYIKIRPMFRLKW